MKQKYVPIDNISKSSFTRVIRNDCRLNVIDKGNHIIHPQEWFVTCIQVENNYFLVQNDKRLWNVMNSQGRILFPNEWFTAIKSANDKLFYVYDRNWKLNLLTTHGEIIFDKPLSYISDYKFGYAIIANDDVHPKWNIINSDGEILSKDLWFDSVKRIKHPSIFQVSQGRQRYNFINAKGQLLLPNMWLIQASEFSLYGLSLIQRHSDGKWNIMDVNGNVFSKKWVDIATIDTYGLYIGWLNNTKCYFSFIDKEWHSFLFE